MGTLIQENPLNKNMHNQPYTVGVISAPDNLYNPILYSHYQATKEYNQMDKDIYQATKKQHPADEKKTPLPVIVISIAGAIFGLFQLVKHLIKK